jgi:hypothetical protein
MTPAAAASAVPAGLLARRWLEASADDRDKRGAMTQDKRR